jgi:hypothetical protein
LRKSNKNYGLVVLIFSLTGIFLLWLITFIIDFGVKHSDDTQVGVVNRIMDHQIDPQIIAFGASAGEVSIDPEIIQKRTGLTCFNSCINGTRFLQYQGLINEFNAYSENNKVMILSESYFSFEKISAVTSIETYLPHLNNDNVYHSLFMIQPDLTWKCKYIPFYKYIAATHIYYKNAAIGWNNFLHHRSYSGLGYFPVDRNWEPDADATIESMGRFVITFDPVIIDQYIKVIRNAESRNRKVVILLTPEFSEMLEKVTDINPLRAKLDSIATVTKAVFLDFTTQPICKDKTMFYNSIHLNETGSKIFSAILADSLKKIVYGTR